MVEQERSIRDGGASVLPLVDAGRCTGCGECVQRCPAGAVQLLGGEVVFTASERCTYCGVCEDVCPEGAVSLFFEVSFAGARTGDREQV